MTATPFSPPWDYQPDPPYTLIIGSTLDDTTMSVHDLPGLEEALRAFIRFNLPPITLRCAYVSDDHGAAVLGYGNFIVDGNVGTEAITETIWLGTEAGFSSLEQLYPHQIDVLAWRTQARVSLHGVEVE